MTAPNPAMRVRVDVLGQPQWTLLVTKLGHPTGNADPTVDDLRRYRVEHVTARGTRTVTEIDHRHSEGTEVLVALALVAINDAHQNAAAA